MNKINILFGLIIILFMLIISNNNDIIILKNNIKKINLNNEITTLKSINKIKLEANDSNWILRNCDTTIVTKNNSSIMLINCYYNKK